MILMTLVKTLVCYLQTIGQLQSYLVGGDAEPDVIKSRLLTTNKSHSRVKNTLETEIIPNIRVRARVNANVKLFPALSHPLSHSQFPIPLSHYPSKRQINPRARDFFRFRQLVLPVALRLSLHHQ